MMIAPTDRIATVAAELRERTRRVLGEEIERTLRKRLRHLPEEDRASIRTMIEAATESLLCAPSARLQALAEHPEVAASRGAAMRELFGLG
ncbi:MAG: hypothetical protein HY744_16585 [Deltaproteobacteria bacterium]|nr:hypothetical protein [Deltaproteobacteria bacterium]